MARFASRGHIKTAIKAVRLAKWRSLFTMLGVIIGVVSVITIVAIGEGVKHQVSQQVNSLGKNLITVRPGEPAQKSSTATKINVLSSITSSGALSQNDYLITKASQGVAYSVPFSVVSSRVSGDTGTYTGGLVIATTQDLPRLLSQAVAYGAFFNADETTNNVAVIGKNVAQALFNQDVPLGHSFTLLGQSFVVDGVFNEFNSAPLSPDADFNNAIFVPLEDISQITGGHAPIYQILVKPKNDRDINRVMQNINSDVLKAHGGLQDFSVMKQSESFSNTNNVLSLLTGLIAGIAAISLLVGGVGIMDVMLVSVTERMHEIGIRKAIGATNRQIMAQFLTESTVLSIGGGIIGIAIAFLIDFLLHVFTHLEPIITWQVVVIAVGVSIAVGIVFGTAPALKAARKDPIDALRND